MDIDTWVKLGVVFGGIQALGVPISIWLTVRSVRNRELDMKSVPFRFYIPSIIIGVFGLLTIWALTHAYSVMSQHPVRVDQQAVTPATATKKELAVNSPPSEEQVRPKQPAPRPTNLTHEQIWQIKFFSLAIPRPCFVKITAAPGNADFRAGFRDALADTFLQSLQGNQTMIARCTLIQDDKDSSPESYTEELNRMSPEIVINGADTAMMESFVRKVREATGMRLKVRAGTTKPPVDMAATWIYVQIGPGSLWNER